MKKLLILLTLLYATVAWTQQRTIAVNVIEPEYITVTVDSVTEKTIYVAFPHTYGIKTANHTPLDTSAFNSADSQAKNPVFSTTGDVFISVVLDTMGAEDSDSLFAYIKPYVYDESKGTWYQSATDVSYLVFDTAGQYTSSTVDYLDWTHGSCYTASLSNELWPCSGFTLTLDEITSVANSGFRAYVGIWITR